MGVNKKYKRKIIIEERAYYWYVKEDDELYGYPFLNIISIDRKFVVSYLLDSCLIIIKGKDFNGIEHTGHQWKWIEVPFDRQKNITPAFVEKVVKWCLSPKNNIKYLDYKYLDSYRST